MESKWTVEQFLDHLCNSCDPRDKDLKVEYDTEDESDTGNFTLRLGHVHIEFPAVADDR